MSEKQDVTVIDEKPAYLQKLEGQRVHNDDNFDSSDIVVPQIKLLQATSKELEAYDSAKSGKFWHTGFDELVGDHVDFVVCSRKKKYLLVAPMEDGQGVLARAEDFKTWDRIGKWEIKIKGRRQPVTWEITDHDVIKSGLDKWGTSNPDDEDSPPAATLFYEYLVLLPDHLDWGPAVLSLTRSAVKKAKKGLNDKIKLHESAGRPMQALVFRAKPVREQNNEGQDYWNFQFSGNGFASEGLYNQANELRDMLKTYQVQDEAEAAAPETQAEAAESDDY